MPTITDITGVVQNVVRFKQISPLSFETRTTNRKCGLISDYHYWVGSVGTYSNINLPTCETDIQIMFMVTSAISIYPRVLPCKNKNLIKKRKTHYLLIHDSAIMPLICAHDTLFTEAKNIN